MADWIDRNGTIPGSFNMDWGMEVWMRVGKHYESEDQSPGSCSEDQQDPLESNQLSISVICCIATEDLTEKGKEILCCHESQISELI